LRYHRCLDGPDARAVEEWSMRIWHSILLVYLAALTLTLCRDPAGRVSIIVFLTGIAELICATAAVMMLFRTIGSIGEAKGMVGRLRGLVASVFVLAIAGGMMAGTLAFGLTMVFRFV
jgi:hypothetical protein